MVDVVDRFEDVLDLVRFGDGAVLTEQGAAELDRIERLRDLDGLDTSYVVAVVGGVAVGLVPLFPTPGRLLVANRLAELYPGRAGQLRGAGSVLLIGSDMASLNMFTVVAAVTGVSGRILDAIHAVAAGLRADFVCAPMLDTQQYEWISSAFPACGSAVSETAEAYLDLRFDSFDGYIAGLPSGWRAKRRKERRRFLQSDLCVREVPPANVAAEAAPLLAQVEDKYGRRRTRLEHELNYLKSTALAMGRRGSALVAEHDGRLVAFSVLWDTGEQWRVRCWGCDYGASVVKQSFAYFNLVIYEPLIRAVNAGAARLVLGSGSLPAKLERGAAVRRLRSLCWEARTR